MKSSNFEQYEIIERAKNFYGDLNPLTIQSELFYMELQGLSEIIEVDIDKLRGISEEDSLKMIFSRIFNFVTASNDNYSIFDSNMVIHDDVFNACFYTVLCMFLHETKRTGGMSIRKFLYLHSPLEFNKRGSRNYFDYEINKREFSDRFSEDYYKCTLILSEDEKLRKFRQRLFKNRPSHYDSSEWSAIKKDSEQEWTLYFNFFNANKSINANEKKTLKDIKNLYNPIYKVLHSANNEDEYKLAYNKFLSKLKKIEYENVLNLSKFILENIQEDKDYYGINLYRFEKELRLYNISKEIQLLLGCHNDEERERILDKSIIMNELFFPRLYEYFGNQNTYKETYYYTYTFFLFLDEIVISNYLVLDKFIDNGLLGENWENLFLKTINTMTSSVLYDSKDIDFTAPAGAQEKFVELLSAPVRYLIFQKTGINID